MFPHTVKRRAVKKTIIRDEGDDALFADSIGCPAKCFDVSVIECLSQGGRRGFDVGFLYACIHGGVFAIFVVIVLALLPDVIGWIADDDKHRRCLLSLHAFSVFLC